MSSHGRPGTLVLLVALGAASSACTKPPAPTADANQKTVVTVAAPIATQVTPFVYATGNVFATESVRLRPRVSGFIESIHFLDGARVEGPADGHPGQLLFLIDPRPFESRRDSAAADLALKKATLDETERKLERLEKALEGQAAPELDVIRQRALVQEARALTDQAQANLRSAQLDLDYASVRAPIGGRISEREQSVGNLVGTGDVLATIVKLRPVWVKFDVGERDYLALAAAHRKPSHIANVVAEKVRIDVALANETGFPHSGTIDYVAPQVDPETGTIEGRGVFDNEDDALQPGFFVQVRLQTSPVPRDVLLVSDRAIGTDQGEKYVLVLGKDNVVASRSVKLGPLESGFRVVEAGLRPGERIVVDGLQRVRPGLAVEPRAIEMPRSIATSPGGEAQP